MNIYITTDTHFNHDKLIKEGLRPADFEKKIRKHLFNLKRDDLLIHLGDFCIGDDKELNENFCQFCWAKKILVRGNHDHKSDSFYYDCGWDFVCDQFTLNKFGKKITFVHDPSNYITVSGMVIHGHWHDDDHRWEPDFQEWYDEKIYKKLALEENNYQPWTLKKLI